MNQAIRVRPRRTMRVIWTLLLLLVAAGAVFYYQVWAEEQKPQIVPVVFLHGFGGGEQTFAPMIRQFEQQGAGQLTDRFEIGPGGQITATLDTYHQQPLVQVLFTNNVSALQDQLNWLKQCIDRLKQKYQTDRIDFVAHSMGGVLATKYILEQGGQDVHKLVTLGSPLQGSKIANFLNTFVDKATLALAPAISDLTGAGARESLANLSAFNPNVQVLSVAGIVKDTTQFEGEKQLAHAVLSALGGVLNGEPGDGVVDKTSALYLNTVTGNFTPYECDGCFHSDIQNSPDVMTRVEQFIRAK